MNAADDPQRRLRAERREFIRAHHPDVGGDPAAFEAGLRNFDRPSATTAGRPGQRLRVVRSRRPDRVVRRLIRRFVDRRTDRVRRHLD